MKTLRGHSPPPADPAVRQFIDALADGIADELIAEIRQGRLPEVLIGRDGTAPADETRAVKVTTSHDGTRTTNTGEPARTHSEERHARNRV